MNRRIYVFIILMLTFTFGSVNVSYADSNVAKDGEVIRVIAKGLVCEFCAKALEKVFMRSGIVESVSVDLTSKEILISMLEGETIDDDVLRKMIRDSGYNIDSIDRNYLKVE